MKKTTIGYQVYTYGGTWVPSGKRIGRTLLFGGEIFLTKREAESAWYDTMPGRNDRAIYVPVQV